MPEALDWPEMEVTDDNGETYNDPLTFICQLRCEDFAPFDKEGLLPHRGMLWFFAALDYYLGDIDSPAYSGIGKWNRTCFRVLYSPVCDVLHTHHLNFPDGTPATMPAEAVTFSSCGAADDGLKLLGVPYIDDVREAMPGRLSLLQIDENDRWQLTFHDCGTLNFLVSVDDLKHLRWEEVDCYLFSF
jgi:uncharacterized protein YwqG